MSDTGKNSFPDAPAGKARLDTHTAFASLPRCPGAQSDLMARFEAAVRGVQAGFTHLSETDIAHPPAHWPDARLALQIALHLLVTRLGASRRGAALELGRSPAIVAAGVRVVEERLADPAFATAYAAMAERAREARAT